ncbi:MAG: STAS domain-containing protein [Planctomycetes bacterium]|nr:STAS domain-containing protein [Planctomycetota bacterium]
MEPNTSDEPFALRREGDVVVVTLRGRFDQELCPRLRSALGAEKRLVMDLGGVDYLSSSGIGELVRLSIERKLKLAALNDKVRGVLQLAQVDRILEIHPTVAEAVAAFRR